MLSLISCPECDAPAEITERFRLPSTDGPVEHIVVQCVADHYFRMAADRLSSRTPGLVPTWLAASTKVQQVRIIDGRAPVGVPRAGKPISAPTPGHGERHSG